MIVGISMAPFDMLRALAISRFRFHITGSRYFGYSRPDSDWDFFTQDRAGLADYLKSKNFKRIGMKPEWLGSNTLAIFRNELCNVEVEIERDWELKNRAQQYIYASEELLDRLQLLPKFERGQVWETAYEYLRKSVPK